MGVAVRRYIDILIIIITFPYAPLVYISSFFGSSVPISLFIFLIQAPPAKTMSGSIIVHTLQSLRIYSSPFQLWINPILLTSGSPFALWINPILLTILLLRSGLVFSLILLTSGSLFGLWMSTILLTSGSSFGLLFSLILFTSIFLYRL